MLSKMVVTAKKDEILVPSINDTVEELNDGLFKMTFSKKTDAAGATDFNDRACNG